MTGTDGMLDSLTGDLVDQRKGRAALFILHPCAVLLILVPMLVLISGIVRCKNDLAMTNGKGVIWISLGNDPNSGFVRESKRATLMADMLNSNR